MLLESMGSVTSTLATAQEWFEPFLPDLTMILAVGLGILFAFTMLRFLWEFFLDMCERFVNWVQGKNDSEYKGWHKEEGLRYTKILSPTKRISVSSRERQ